MSEQKEAKMNISHAICAVMNEVKRLEKSDRNKHGGYDFTSVDDFKDKIRPIMAKNGLEIHVSQQKFEMIEYTVSKNGKEEKRAVAQFDIAITLSHISGQKSDPEIMTVALPFTGAQTSGAARSYAIKEWIKSRFLASSGDARDEADMLEQSREGMRLSKADAREIHAQLQKEMREKIDGKDHVELREWWQENSHRTEVLPKDWFLMLRTELIDAGKRLKAEAELDAMTNDQLDQLGMQQENMNA